MLKISRLSHLPLLLLLITFFTLNFVKSEVIEPVSLSQAEEVIQDNINHLVGILYLDPTRIDLTLDGSNGNDEGAVGRFFSSIRGMFSSRGKTIYDFGTEIGEKFSLLEIDTSNPEYHTLHQLFQVENLPYLVLVY